MKTAAHLHAVPADPPAPVDPLADAKSALQRFRDERNDRFIERLGEVLALAIDITGDDGAAPGMRNGARRVLTALTVERDAMQAVRGRQ